MLEQFTVAAVWINAKRCVFRKCKLAQCCQQLSEKIIWEQVQNNIELSVCNHNKTISGMQFRMAMAIAPQKRWFYIAENIFYMLLLHVRKKPIETISYFDCIFMITLSW